MRTNNGQFYAGVEMYVERIVTGFLKPNRDFKSIQYRRCGTTSDAYIRLVDAVGDSYYFDATAMNEEGICRMICDVVALQPTEKQITDIELKREITPLFD